MQCLNLCFFPGIIDLMGDEDKSTEFHCFETFSFKVESNGLHKGIGLNYISYGVEFMFPYRQIGQYHARLYPVPKV